MDPKKTIIGLLVAVVLMASLVINQVQLGGEPLDIGIDSLSVTPGCKLLGTIETTADTYTCDADQCEVYGLINCDTSVSEQKVIMRCGAHTPGVSSTKWIAYDVTGDGNLDYLGLSGSASWFQSRTPLGCCPNNICLYEYKEANGNSVYSSTYTAGSLITTVPYILKVSPNYAYVSSAPQAGYSELLGAGSGYSCNIKFCPTKDGSYALCDKIVSQSSAWSSSTTKYASAYTLKRGESISFRPTDGNGALLPTAKSTFVVTRWDCSCLSECTIGIKQCVGTNTYSTCTASSTGGCNSFTGISSCPTGQVCKTTTTGGECGCDTNQCAYGTRVCDGTNGYKTCLRNSAGCTYWSTTTTCPKDKVQMVCNTDLTSSTACKIPTQACQTYSKQCLTSTSYIECLRDSNGANYWSPAPKSCGNNEVCKDGSCSSPADLSIIAQPSYSLGQKLSFTIKAANSVGDLSGNQVYTTLIDSNGYTSGTAQCILSKNLLSNDYSCTAEYLAGVSTTGQYTIKAEVSPSNLPGIKLTAQASFNAYTGAGVSIRTDTVVYTHELAQAYLSVTDDLGSPVPMCSQNSNDECFERWVVEPKVNGQLVQYNLIPQVEAGKVKLTYSVPSAGKVSLKAWTEGGQLSTQSAERTDIVAQAPEIDIEYNIPSTVNYGTNKFEFKTWAPTNDLDTERAALNIPTDAVTVVITLPDNTKKSIHPMKATAGEYFFNLDMPQDAGQAYSMTITASYSNWRTKTTPTIFVSAQSGTVTPVSGTDWPMYVIIGLGVVLVVVLIITRVRRR